MAKVKKLIDLPENIIGDLQTLADNANNSVKGYIEWVVIQHVKEKAPKGGAKGLK